MSEPDTTTESDRIVSPQVAMALLVYERGLSSSEALVLVSRALEKERQGV